MKALAPIYAIAFLDRRIDVRADAERARCRAATATRLLITLAACLRILRVMSLKRARLPYVEFDEAPASITRRRWD